jgi:hypothetical protein
MQVDTESPTTQPMTSKEFGAYFRGRDLLEKSRLLIMIDDWSDMSSEDLDRYLKSFEEPLP